MLRNMLYENIEEINFYISKEYLKYQAMNHTFTKMEVFFYEICNETFKN